jgi:hypothetical protein
VLTCAFCSATLFVDRSGLVSHYRLPRRLDRDHALEALRRWMNGNETVKDLDKKSEIAGVEALSFPMWLFRSQGAKAGGGGEEVRVQPAAATPIPQIADLEIPAGQLEPARQDSGGEPGATTSPVSVPLDTARGWMGEAAGRLTETALVQVPLWHCRYRYRGQEYGAYVEGSTGAVLASVYPAKAESPYYAVAALGLALFLIEGLVIGNVFLKVLVYAVTAVPLALVAFWVTRKV